MSQVRENKKQKTHTQKSVSQSVYMERRYLVLSKTSIRHLVYARRSLMFGHIWHCSNCPWVDLVHARWFWRGPDIKDLLMWINVLWTFWMGPNIKNILVWTQFFLDILDRTKYSAKGYIASEILLYIHSISKN